MLVLGGAIAGLSGGILVSYISTWSPAAWGYAETVVLFAAVIIGGAGNHRGAILGAILVPVGFEEVTRYIPTSNNLPPNLIPSLQWVAIGLLIVVFLWVRPQGILPERKRVIQVPAWLAGWRAAGGAARADGASEGWHDDVGAGVARPEARGADGDGGQRDALGSPRQPAPLGDGQRWRRRDGACRRSDRYLGDCAGGGSGAGVGGRGWRTGAMSCWRRSSWFGSLGGCGRWTGCPSRSGTAR